MPGRFCWNQPTRKPCSFSLQTWKKHLRSHISSQFKTPESSKHITVNKKARPLSSDVHWHSHRSYQQTLTLMIWLLLSLTSWKFFAQLQSDHGSNWLHFFFSTEKSATHFQHLQPTGAIFTRQRVDVCKWELSQLSNLQSAIWNLEKWIFLGTLI